MKNSLPKLRAALLLLLTLLLPALRVAAQATTTADTPEMADALRQNGKIYVVVAVITVVLAGLLLFLISLDRKLSRLEKEVKD
ncbi:CcmD family protein [Hymenobacter sp. 5516J-16]|uniref:CcmD family protein n=1 Tax=Hymenobacter sublimis TaxID=2933777 RepID=A0ABY4JA96_9BACT|nr:MULTISPECIES: CcmD family protein [Hymenobacter]UOQ75851.1 CcmD family protein [Hymenobacter sp. 5516J-16]UPL49530.1 CcmD family protein [Hymenobacter sublimis]